MERLESKKVKSTSAGITTMSKQEKTRARAFVDLAYGCAATELKVKAIRESLEK